MKQLNDEAYQTVIEAMADAFAVQVALSDLSRVMVDLRETRACEPDECARICRLASDLETSATDVAAGLRRAVEFIGATATT